MGELSLREVQGFDGGFAGSCGDGASSHFFLQSQDRFLPSLPSFFSASVSLVTIRLMLSFEDEELCKARAWAQGTPCLMEDRHLNGLLWKVAVTGTHSHVSLQREERLPLSGDSGETLGRR